MALGKDTEEFLALRFPHSYHLFEDIEYECETIQTRAEGWGWFKIASQGLERGKLLVKIVETALSRRRTRNEPPTKAFRQKQLNN